jgi:hypothetical protein
MDVSIIHCGCLLHLWLEQGTRSLKRFGEGLGMTVGFLSDVALSNVSREWTPNIRASRKKFLS